MSLKFEIQPVAIPTSVKERAAKLADPGFGRIFTDHMAIVRTTRPRAGMARASNPAPISRSIRPPPCCTTRRRFSKASRPTSATTASTCSAPMPMRGASGIGRPDGHGAAARGCLHRSGRAARAHRQRLDSGRRGQPLFAALHDRERGFPRRQAVGRIHLRCHRLAGRLLLQGRACAGVDLGVGEYTRAALGGTGAVKCGGNYAASLRAQAEAIEHGCDQVVFLDAVERRYIEELGGMNIFFVFEDGRSDAAARHDPAGHHPRFDHHARPGCRPTVAKRPTRRAVAR